MESEVSKTQNEVDIFRDTPVRLLGYANELGEAFRSVVHARWVWLSYGVATADVFAGTGSKTLAIRKQVFPSEQERNLRSFKEGIDVLSWQALASVIIPGITINRICATANYFFSRSEIKRHAKWLTVAVGLTSIPFIIKPIDEFVDFLLDTTVRPMLETNILPSQEELNTKRTK